MIDMLTIGDVQACYKATLKAGATPHRNPDFKKILDEVEAGLFTPLYGRLWFLEEHNTGIDGCLERWEFHVPDTTIRFWADLLPGLITMVPK